MAYTSINFIRVLNNQCLLNVVFPILSASNDSICSCKCGGGEGLREQSGEFCMSSSEMIKCKYKLSSCKLMIVI